MGVLPTGGVTAGDRQSPESDVVHDHIRLRQHQIAPVAYIGVHIRGRHVEHAGTTQRGETMGRSPCGSQLTPRGGCDRDDQQPPPGRRSRGSGQVR